jgi:N-glycosylase/DNA lyase
MFTGRSNSLPVAASVSRAILPVRDYDLEATLTSGQVFRWRLRERGWEGVIGTRWVRLAGGRDAIVVEAASPTAVWDGLREYLQLDVDLGAVLAAFPPDAPMRAAIAACRGLRLLRQDPWECLASFVLSSTKQIVQIQQIIALMCERYGQPVAVPPGHAPEFGFPTPERIAACTEAELRGCKAGFRAGYLRATAQRLASGEVHLAGLARLPLAEARGCLMGLPGVGRKVADCVLLFACGFQQAFPIDVWVDRALRQLYFPRRRMSPARLREFSERHFGPYAGYAQQYLFHYMRTMRGGRE